MKPIAWAAGLAAAGLGAQAPEYAQQYQQRLAGAVDELQVIVADFDASAEAVGLTRDQALAELAGSPFLRERNADMTRTMLRYEKLSGDLARLREAGPVGQALIVPARLDTDIGRRAMEDFQPGLPVSAAGFGFALGGFGAGYALWLGIAAVLAFGWRRLARRPATG